jgi:nucleotide-binding universal stress UspA family protein
VIGGKKEPGSAYSSLDPGVAILNMGRPTLVVAEGGASPCAEHVLIGWKDTREARRAVLDALPFLREASRITIVEACRREEEKTALARLDDMVRYLMRHQIECVPKAFQQEGSGATQLVRIAHDEHADLLVTGAYGHSRLGEWIFGGITRDLIAQSPICCLLSY